MQWYYADNDRQQGPVSDEEIKHLSVEGVVRGDTLVWQEGMTEWKPYATVQGGADLPRPPVPVGPEETTCRGCRRPFPAADLMPSGAGRLCATCSSVRSPSPDVGVLPMYYAGFWIRFVAAIVDGIVRSVLAIFISILGAVLLWGTAGPENPASAMAVNVMTQVLGMLVGLAYDVFFVGYFAATPGKMVCGIKIVRADGSRVTYARAVGRHFAEWLSGLILMIGYIMVAFDPEKRALHDYICDTRVVWSSPVTG